MCLEPVKLLGVDVDLIDYGAISLLDQTDVDLGIFLNGGVREYFAVWPDYLDLVTNNEVHRLSRARIESDRCPRRIIGYRPRTAVGRGCRCVARIRGRRRI